MTFTLLISSVAYFASITRPGFRITMFKIIFSAVLVVIVFAGGGYAAYKFMGDSGKSDIHSYTIDQPIVMHTKGGLLEVSKVLVTEHFESSVINTVLGVGVSKTTARARVPAVYRYHIELAPEWKFEIKDGTFFVVAPAVKPALPVAIDTTQLVSDSSGAWSMVNGQKKIDELVKRVTPILAAKAISQQYIDLQRNEARKTVEEFIRKWLLAQEKWKPASAYPMHVTFSDEPVSAVKGIQ